MNEKEENQKDSSPYEEFLHKRIGVGKSQFYSSFALSTIWLADGSEIYVIGLIMPIIAIEWDLSAQRVNQLGTLVFLGVAIGAMVAGYLSDKYGRRVPLIWSSIFLFISSFSSYIVPDFNWLLITRLAFGIGMGLGVPTIATYQAEMQIIKYNLKNIKNYRFPYNCRGKYFSLFQQFFPLGELSVVVFAWFTFENLKNGNWRNLLLWAALPTIPCIIFIYFSVKESARFYLLCTNKNKEIAFNIMDEMGKANKAENYQPLTSNEKQQIELWVDDQKSQSQNDSKSYFELFSSGNAKKTFLLSIVWFSLSFVYYGLAFILPQILIKMRNSQNQDLSSYSNNDFYGIMATVIVEFPSNYVSSIIVQTKTLGRVKSLGFSFLLAGACSIFAYFETVPNNFFFVMVSLVKFFIRICFMVGYTFTSELYQTKIRGRGLSFTNAVCRIGGMLMPTIGTLCFYFGDSGPLLSFAFISLLSALATFSLSEPQENIDSQASGYIALQENKQN